MNGYISMIKMVHNTVSHWSNAASSWWEIRITVDGDGKSYPGRASRLIDNDWSSIYYDAYGIQIFPIPSSASILKVNNNILQNKYNYYGAAAVFHLQKFKNRGV